MIILIHTDVHVSCSIGSARLMDYYDGGCTFLAKKVPLFNVARWG